MTTGVALAADLRSASFWRSRFGYALCGAAIVVMCAAYYAHRWPDAAAFGRDIDEGCAGAYCDFRWFYYKQAQRILQAEQPIFKYFYSPTFALALVPLARLPLAAANIVWTWLQAGSLLLLVAASLLLLQRQARWTHALALLLTLTSYPMLHNWKWGQANTTFLALILLGLALYERSRPHLAALSLSLVVASRYYPVSYGVAFLQPGRRKAFVLLIVYSFALLVDVPIVCMGLDRAVSFYRWSATEVAQNTSGWIVIAGSSNYLPSTLLRWARAWQFELAGSRAVWSAVSAAIAACNFALAFWAVQQRVAERTLWAFCFVALSTPLLAPTSWIHYFVYLPLVLTFLAAELAKSHASLQLKAAGFALVLLPAAWLSSLHCYDVLGDALRYALRGCPLIANLLLLGLAYALFATRPACARETLRPDLLARDTRRP